MSTIIAMTGGAGAGKTYSIVGHKEHHNPTPMTGWPDEDTLLSRHPATRVGTYPGVKKNPVLEAKQPYETFSHPVKLVEFDKPSSLVYPWSDDGHANNLGAVHRYKWIGERFRFIVTDYKLVGSPGLVKLLIADGHTVINLLLNTPLEERRANLDRRKINTLSYRKYTSKTACTVASYASRGDWPSSYERKAAKLEAAGSDVRRVNWDGPPVVDTLELTLKELGAL